MLRSERNQPGVSLFALVKETFAEFGRHKAQWLSAAIAYYALFAAAPLIIVVVEIAGFFLGEHHRLLGELYEYLSRTAGRSAATGIESIVTATFSQRRAGTISQILGWIVFVAGAAGLFGSLQEALNTMWDVTPPKRSLLESLRVRLPSFAMVLVVALLLMLSLAVNSALTLAAHALAQSIPALPLALKIADCMLSAALVTVLFAIVFRFLPDARVPWRSVWLGAAMSAALFVLGQFLLGWYIGRAALSSGYASFGGIVVFLIWVYYSAQILLLGAEFTHVYSRHRGFICQVDDESGVVAEPV